MIDNLQRQKKKLFEMVIIWGKNKSSGNRKYRVYLSIPIRNMMIAAGGWNVSLLARLSETGH
jgi:hypothetical protein